MDKIEIQKSIYQNYAEFKVEFHKQPFIKSGMNKSQGFKYFELSDFSDVADEILLKHGLVFVGPTWEVDAAGTPWVIARLYDLTGLQSIEFRHLHETSKNSNNPIQNYGADITYWRRFMKGMVCELLENDQVDSADNSKKNDNFITNDQWALLNKLYTKEEVKAMYSEVGITNGKNMPKDFAQKKIDEKSMKTEDMPDQKFF